MKLKAIVLDIDGTLLSPERRITQATKDILIKAQQQGVKVILASGRPTSGMMKYAKELELEKYKGFLISYNGACGYDVASDSLAVEESIPKTIAQAVLEHMKKFQVIPMINDDTYMYVNNVYKGMLTIQNQPINIIEYESRGGNFHLCEVDDLATFATFPIYKILIAGDPDYLASKWKVISDPFIHTLTGAFSAPMYYEFTNQGIDKAKTLAGIMKMTEIMPDETIAFGDSHNDISLLKFAGIGVAMGNAVPEVKAIADEVTLTNS